MKLDLSWKLTSDQRIGHEALDPDQRATYTFARDWGVDHEEALAIAADGTGELLTALSERVFE